MSSDRLHEKVICATPFVPESADNNYDAEEWHNEAVQDSNGQFKIRFLRVLFIVTAPLTLLIIASFIKTISVSFIIGAGILCMFIVYFIVIFRLVFIFGNDADDDAVLYRIYSMCKRPKKWAANLQISYIQLLYVSYSIESISELSAIHGGVTKSMLNTLGAYTWIAITIHYVVQIKWHNNFKWDIADICMIIGCMGLLLISIFELDPFNAKMKFMHYFGALCGAATVIGYILQQYTLHNGEYFIFSIFLAIICFMAFIGWQISNYATKLSQFPISLTQRGGEKYNCFFTPLAKLLIPNHDKIRISTYSRMNIGFEAIFLFIGALSLSLFLMDYDSNYNMI